MSIDHWPQSVQQDEDFLAIFYDIKSRPMSNSERLSAEMMKMLNWRDELVA